MRILNRVCLALLAVATFGCVPSAHAQSQGCTVTVKKSGYQFHSLNAKNMKCDEANGTLERALNLAYNQQMPGYRCAQTPSGSGGRLNCDATNSTDKHIDATWSMPSQRH